MAEYYKKGKTNWLKLILIYLVIGGVIYYLVYYFFLKGKYSTSNYKVPTSSQAPSTTSAPKNPYNY